MTVPEYSTNAFPRLKLQAHSSIAAASQSGPEQARRWQISMGGTKPPKSPFSQGSPLTFNTNIFPQGGHGPLAPPSATGLGLDFRDTL